MKRSPRFWIFLVVLGVVAFGRLDVALYTAPGGRQVHVPHRQDFDSPPLVLGLPTDGCRVFVGNQSSGVPLSWRWTGQCVDMCQDTIGPAAIEGKAAVLALSPGPGLAIGFRNPRLTLFGFTWRRPVLTSVAFVFPAIELRRCECGILVLQAPDGRALMWLLVWNSFARSEGGLDFMTPSRRQVGLLWPTWGGGWGVWIWNLLVQQESRFATPPR